MGLETGVNFIDDLVATNPLAGDNPSEGDDHLRAIKTAVKGSFTSLGSAAVTKTAAEINDLATLTGTETLTNKTLTSPTITDPTFSGTATGLDAEDFGVYSGLLDGSGGTITKAGTVAGAWTVSSGGTSTGTVTHNLGGVNYVVVLTINATLAGQMGDATVTAQAANTFSFAVNGASLNTGVFMTLIDNN